MKVNMRPFKARKASIACDASLSYAAVVNQKCILAREAHSLEQSQAECFAYLLATAHSRYILTDSRVVFHQRFKSYHPVISCILLMQSRDVRVWWVNTTKMPADNASRGGFVVPTFPSRAECLPPHVRQSKLLSKLLHRMPKYGQITKSVRWAEPVSACSTEV